MAAPPKCPTSEIPGINMSNTILLINNSIIALPYPTSFVVQRSVAPANIIPKMAVLAPTLTVFGDDKKHAVISPINPEKR